MAIINTALNTEIAKGDFQAVKNLIENQSYSPNYTGFLGLAHTPLYTAVTSKQVEILDYLIQKGADVNASGGWDEKPIELALTAKHVPMVASLLAANAQIPHSNYYSDSTNNYAKTKIVTDYLVKATSSNDTDSIKKILQNPYADINKSNLDDNYKKLPTALETAVKANHVEATALLLEKGAKIAPFYSFDWKDHPLTIVKDAPIAELLIEHTPNINNALLMFTILEKADFIPLLVKHGALINDRYFDKHLGFMTPLEAAITKDDSAMIKCLVSNGADLALESANHSYATPLEYAALHGKLQALEILIELGADVTHKNALSNETALELAFKAGQTGAVNILTLHGAEVPEYIQAKLDLLKPIETNQVLTADQIITPPGQDVQAIQQDSHSIVSDNKQPESIYVHPLEITLPSDQHYEHAFGGLI